MDKSFEPIRSASPEPQQGCRSTSWRLVAFVALLAVTLVAMGAAGYMWWVLGQKGPQEATIPVPAAMDSSPPAVTETVSPIQTEETPAPIPTTSASEPPAVPPPIPTPEPVSFTSSISAAVRLTLADMGYDSDGVFQGNQGSHTISFPLPEGGITGGQVTLHLRPSPVLHPLSTIQIYFNGQPVTTLTAKSLGQDATLVFPVKATTDDSLTVRIDGYLYIGDDLCVDDRSRNLWVAVGKDSELVYTYSPQATSLRGFLSMPIGRILVHGLWDNPQNQALSMGLFSGLRYVYRDTPVQVMLAGSTAVSPIVQEETSLPLREVFLTTEPNAIPLRLQDYRLYVAANQDALLELVAKAGEALRLGRAVEKLDKAPTLPAFPQEAGSAEYRLSLADMGIGGQEKKGFAGEFSISVNFTLADLGGWPKDLSFFLDTVFDPVPASTLERAFIRVKFNGGFLDSVDIRGQSALQRTIPLPSYLLRPKNSLQVIFVYAPESGHCLGAPWMFTGQLLESSYFGWSSYESPPYLFPAVIGYLRGEGELYLFDRSPATARAVALLLGGLSQYTSQPLLPRLGDPALLQKPSSTYRILVGGDKATLKSLGLPLQLDQKLDIADPQTGKSILKGKSDRPLAGVQFVPGTPPLLAFQASPDADEAMLQAAVTRMTDPEEFFDLKGNVVVATDKEVVGVEPVSSPLQVRASQSVVELPWVERYRWPLLGLLVVLLIIFWWLVYRRIGRQPPPQVPPSR